jgi:hypothetical protein
METTFDGKKIVGILDQYDIPSSGLASQLKMIRLWLVKK